MTLAPEGSRIAAEPVIPAPLLAVERLAKSYGGVRALADANLDVRSGEVHALLGENGAGKSTLIKIVAGGVSRDAGTVRWRGAPVELATPADAQHLGIRVIYQQLSIVDHLSVADNLTLGSEHTRLGFIDRGEARARARGALEQLGHPLDLERPAGGLKVAEKQLLEIARAISADARLLVMDEPTASLGDAEVERLFEVIRGLRDRGIGIVFISHRLDEILDIADRVTILRDGLTIRTLPIAEASRELLISLMVGRTLGHDIQHRSHATHEVVLRAQGLSSDTGLADVTFDLHAGEILGVYGLLGSGRTELARALFGADPVTAGTLWVRGLQASVSTPGHAKRLGLGLVPEERAAHGLFGRLSVQENVAAASGELISRFGLVVGRRERDLARRVVDELNVVASSLEQPVGSLSGGNQQKVVVGRWLVRDTPILLLDDPTVGVDVGAKDEIYRIIGDMTERGTAVIVFSSELPEVLALADRVMVLHEGRVAGILDRDALDQKAVLSLAVGDRPTGAPA
jgi:ABC-type sugar transport system ATPase subunit